MTAHQGPVYCVAWHPEERSLLATGGRDQFIQVLTFISILTLARSGI
jgi:hypothetical protein